MLEDGHILYVVNETQNTQHCKACNNDIHKAVRPVQRTEKQTSTVTIHGSINSYTGILLLSVRS